MGKHENKNPFMQNIHEAKIKPKYHIYTKMLLEFHGVFEGSLKSCGTWQAHAIIHGFLEKLWWKNHVGDIYCLSGLLEKS